MLKLGGIFSPAWNVRYRLLALMSLAVFMLSAPARALEAVDLELLLLVDVSRSVDANEYILQRDGYADAFRDPAFYSGYIASGRYRRIAVSLVYWSSPNFRQVAVPWMRVDSSASAAEFAAAIIRGSATSDGTGKNARPFDGTTAPGSALAFGFPRFFDNEYGGLRKVIIVSGDGPENDGISTPKARDEAIAAGVDTINTFPIGSETLKGWYIRNIQAGKDAFTIGAKDFPDLPAAIRYMLQRTLSPNR